MFASQINSQPVSLYDTRNEVSKKYQSFQNDRLFNFRMRPDTEFIPPAPRPDTSHPKTDYMIPLNNQQPIQSSLPQQTFHHPQQLTPPSLPNNQQNQPQETFRYPQQQLPSQPAPTQQQVQHLPQMPYGQSPSYQALFLQKDLVSLMKMENMVRSTKEFAEISRWCQGAEFIIALHKTILRKHGYPTNEEICKQYVIECQKLNNPYS